MSDDKSVYEHHDVDLTGVSACQVVLRDARVSQVDLSGAQAERVRLRGARVNGADLTGLRLTEVLLDDVVIRGAFIEGPVEISGDVEGLVVNGIEIAPLVEAELARRYPDYAAMKPTDADLEREVTVPEGEGWPPAGETMPATQPLLVVLNEEWWHRQYAERDLTALEERSG
ncbi:MAG: pentapeptide repeat-containing protein [Dermatophilaceae bacterium]